VPLESWETIGKKLARNRFRASSLKLILAQLIISIGGNDDGGGGKPDAHWTSSTRDPRNSHSTDMVGSIDTDDTRSRSLDNRNSHIGKPDTQIRFRFPQFPLKPARQNAARERKPIHLPPMQLREAFSCSFPFPPCCFARDESPAKDFFDAIPHAPPSIYRIGCGQLRGSKKMAKTRVLLASPTQSPSHQNLDASLAMKLIASCEL